MSNPGNVARGLKASINNPNVSEEAKERSAERLQEMERSGELESREAHEDNVAYRPQGMLHISWFKDVRVTHRLQFQAALKNPNISEEAKQHSAQILKEMGRD
ncbi:hypothetical protein C8T65DRAFT_734072 [Cerioporus squamosus]|nr:hypothetical protein C8T65DRAFT_734072 [Cerioporus squamosus]